MVATRGRPTEFPIKKLIAIDEEILDAVEAFRAVHQPAMNQSEAFRHILREWLSGNGYLPR
ncbi:hypothetical protein [Rhizobium leguminosarum]